MDLGIARIGSRNYTGTGDGGFPGLRQHDAFGEPPAGSAERAVDTTLASGSAQIMSPVFLLAIGLSTLGVVALLFWALRGSFQPPAIKDGLKVLENIPQHLFNMAQIRQGMDPEDLKYAASKGGTRLAATLRRERRRVALMYLSAIRLDFERLLHIARVVAVFSPQFSVHPEYQRL